MRTKGLPQLSVTVSLPPQHHTTELPQLSATVSLPLRGPPHPTNRKEMAAPEPNLPVLSSALQDASRELSLLTNLPGLEAANQIQGQLAGITNAIHDLQQNMTALNQNVTALQQDMTAGFQQVHTRLGGVENRLTNLETQAAAINWNTYATMMNKKVGDGNGNLLILHHHITNMPIANFPQNANDARQLDNVEINRLLRDLNAPTGGDLPTKITRFLLRIGYDTP
ncbi:hypothetical protein BDV96DRAFT_642003 [Lophiotrema nucula]|uniref:Uncharacterized protein n=1 Tax=Lophiotrema nucula TaxID=690887 RepID=A0A6A5ZMQ7_9PLEO|nr:hypothetical protein BDV96DRAFT_642003 [Lophiotrema nucula]